MNQISTVALPVDTADAFLREARQHLKSLGYEGACAISCYVWHPGNELEWKFQPTIFKSPLPDIEGASLSECITKSREWLQTVRTENETLEAVLGFKA